MLPRTRLLYALAAGAALAAAGTLGLSLYINRSVAKDPARVNKAGLVRGHIQRAAKWALAREAAGGAASSASAAREQAAEVEAALAEAERSLVADPTAQALMGEIRREWRLFQEDFPPEGPERDLRNFERSERLWFLTVALVEAVQLSSEERAGRGRYLAFGLFGLLALAASVLLVVRSYVAGRLEAASIRDALTGLFNRRYFELQLEQEGQRAERYGAPFALIAFDLDRFKDVNDSLGHAEGDRVLKAVAEAVEGRLRRSDLLFRLGGDEFAAILPGAGLEEAREAAEKLRLAIMGLGPEGRGVTASLGVAAREAGEAGEALRLQADKALYAAKAAGRNAVRTASRD